MSESIDDLIAKQKAAAKSLGVSTSECIDKTQKVHPKSDAPQKPTMYGKLDREKHLTLNNEEIQQEILKQLKQINWAVRIGFLFIMLVISGIIKF